MNDKNKFWAEREEVFATLTRKERAILAEYERNCDCKVPAAAIVKVIEDQREIAREKHNRKKAKRKK